MIKGDLIETVFLLICSIVIPPLFIINLIFFLIQFTVRLIKYIKEKKEKEKFERIIYDNKEKGE